MKFNETETLFQNEYRTSTEEYKFGNVHLCNLKLMLPKTDITYVTD